MGRAPEHPLARQGTGEGLALAVSTQQKQAWCWLPQWRGGARGHWGQPCRQEGRFGAEMVHIGQGLRGEHTMPAKASQPWTCP